MAEINHELIEQIYNALTRVASKEEQEAAKVNADAMMGELKKISPTEKYRAQVTNFCGTMFYFQMAQQEQINTLIAQNQRLIELLERMADK